MAIVGRPNVGKSTLFNRIVGGRRAIVHERPGCYPGPELRQSGVGRQVFLAGGYRRVDRRGRRSHHVWYSQQVSLAVDDADVVVFVVDTQAGVHPADLEVADLLRREQDRVVLAANKADDLANDISHHAFHELGISDPIPVSAATGKGSGDLLDRIANLLPEMPAEEDEGTINVAVIGRPNVGKSSIVNRLLGRTGQS